MHGWAGLGYGTFFLKYIQNELITVRKWWCVKLGLPIFITSCKSCFNAPKCWGNHKTEDQMYAKKNYYWFNNRGCVIKRSWRCTFFYLPTHSIHGHTHTFNVFKLHYGDTSNISEKRKKIRKNEQHNNIVMHTNNTHSTLILNTDTVHFLFLFSLSLPLFLYLISTCGYITPR